MAFDKNKFDLIDLEDPTPDPYPYTAEEWGKEFAKNIDNYFSDGVCPYIYNDGTYFYIQVPPLVTNVTPFKTTLGNLYKNESLTAEQWVEALINETSDWWETIVFNGEKMEIAPPHTVTSWTGTVDATDARAYLMISLKNLYMTETPPPVLPDFSIDEQDILDTAAKKCYLVYPTMLLE